MFKKTTLGNVVSVNCYIFYLTLNLWKHFATMSFFLYLKLSYYNWQLVLLLQEVHHHLFIYQQFFLPGLHGYSECFTRPYIYSILMVCNNILFSVLTRNAFPAPLLLISSNTVFFKWYNILDKCS